VSTFYQNQTWNDNWLNHYDYDCGDLVNNSTIDYVGYDQCIGTSQATPMVASIIAVARSINPLRTKTQIIADIVTTPAGMLPPEFPTNSFAMPVATTTYSNAAAINSSITPLFAFRTAGTSWNRFYTTAVQMGNAALHGTMLPTLLGSTLPVYYSPDYPSAPIVSGFSFPDANVDVSAAYVRVYTRHQIGGVDVLPLYRLSKLQDVGGGVYACGYAKPVPGKLIPVLHVYPTSEIEKTQFMSATPGNCFKFDGVEGYLAPYNFGGLQVLYRL
jgi:hypothetical protein